MKESRITDAHAALIRALNARAPTLTIIGSSSTRWASVTFTGARHILHCRIPQVDLTAFADGLDVAEFTLPGHIVADIVIERTEYVGDTTEITIEALTVEDR